MCISEANRLKHEEERLHQLLLGLDNSIFHTVTSQILNMDPLPTMNTAYQMIIRQERHGLIVRGKDERTEVVAYAARQLINPLLFVSSTLRQDIAHRSAFKS